MSSIPAIDPAELEGNRRPASEEVPVELPLEEQPSPPPPSIEQAERPPGPFLRRS